MKTLLSHYFTIKLGSIAQPIGLICIVLVCRYFETGCRVRSMFTINIISTGVAKREI